MVIAWRSDFEGIVFHMPERVLESETVENILDPGTSNRERLTF
jgi:hypothetical protein